MWKHIFLTITCSNCICYCMHVPRADHLVWDKQLTWSPLKKTISPPSAFLSGLYFFVYGWGLVSFPLYTLEYLLLLSLLCLCLGSHTMKLHGCSFSDSSETQSHCKLSGLLALTVFLPSAQQCPLTGTEPHTSAFCLVVPLCSGLCSLLQGKICVILLKLRAGIQKHGNDI